ncbi:hypothetical protein MUP65_01685 [Patescibacteria group bacterium]|nr:hypothetical protein [Patescibacteria group bacterium]
MNQGQDDINKRSNYSKRREYNDIDITPAQNKQSYANDENKCPKAQVQKGFSELENTQLQKRTQEKGTNRNPHIHLKPPQARESHTLEHDSPFELVLLQQTITPPVEQIHQHRQIEKKHKPLPNRNWPRSLEQN